MTRFTNLEFIESDGVPMIRLDADSTERTIWIDPAAITGWDVDWEPNSGRIMVYVQPGNPTVDFMDDDAGAACAEAVEDLFRAKRALQHGGLT
jgi:hypothetical protein